MNLKGELLGKERGWSMYICKHEWKVHNEINLK
jgi:hypothetical protein